MISIELVVAVAVRNAETMDRLGEALRDDLVVANPHLRRVAQFADDFLQQRRKLPADGDWEIWTLGLESGMIRDGTREALGRVLSLDVSGYDPAFFAENILPDLKRAAAQTVRARLNEQTVLEPETVVALAERVSSIGADTGQPLARLSDVDIWAKSAVREDRIPSGMPSLDRYAGGWGKELILLFADSGVGKSILMQNWATSAALKGKNVLGFTLELGIRPEIQRFYRQITQMDRAEFIEDIGLATTRLKRWLTLAKGQIGLLEFQAHTLDIDMLRRNIERAARVMGHVDIIVIDYLDLLAPRRFGKGGAYEDLGKLTHEARSLCGQFDVTVITASQAVRKPANAGRLSEKDMGDSYNKVRASDIILSLVQTEEEEKFYQGRVGVLKLRDAARPRKLEIPVYINKDLSLIAEIAHPSTRNLMEQRGHLPEQLQAVNLISMSQ